MIIFEIAFGILVIVLIWHFLTSSYLNPSSLATKVPANLRCLPSMPAGIVLRAGMSSLLKIFWVRKRLIIRISVTARSRLSLWSLLMR